MIQADHPEILNRLDRLDRRFDEVLDLLVAQRAIKDYYTTDEVAEIVGMAKFTVWEWCRLGRIRGEKRACGRGKYPAWVVSHEELTRYRNEGLLPIHRG